MAKFFRDRTDHSGCFSADLKEQTTSFVWPTNICASSLPGFAALNRNPSAFLLLKEFGVDAPLTQPLPRVI
jgi:hypothetical protein